MKKSMKMFLINKTGQASAKRSFWMFKTFENKKKHNELLSVCRCVSKKNFFREPSKKHHNSGDINFVSENQRNFGNYLRGSMVKMFGNIKIFMILNRFAQIHTYKSISYFFIFLMFFNIFWKHTWECNANFLEKVCFL